MRNVLKRSNHCTAFVVVVVVVSAMDQVSAITTTKHIPDVGNQYGEIVVAAVVPGRRLSMIPVMLKLHNYHNGIDGYKINAIRISRVKYVYVHMHYLL